MKLLQFHEISGLFFPFPQSQKVEKEPEDRERGDDIAARQQLFNKGNQRRVLAPFIAEHFVADRRGNGSPDYVQKGTNCWDESGGHPH